MRVNHYSVELPVEDIEPLSRDDIMPVCHGEQFRMQIILSNEAESRCHCFIVRMKKHSVFQEKPCWQRKFTGDGFEHSEE